MTQPLWLASPTRDDDAHAAQSGLRRWPSAVPVPEDGVPHDVTTDPELLERLRAGDPSAFDALFTAVYASLVGFATHLLRSQDVAEDVVMDVFRRVWERRVDWRPVNVRVYLFGAVRNAAATATRDTATRMRRLALEEPGISPAMGRPDRPADEQLEDAQRLAALAHAVSQLPERQRLAFTLRREQGLTNAQVAEVLGVSVKTIEKDLTAAFSTLRTALASYRAQ